MQDADGAPYGACQPEIHAAQDGESKITVMLQMRCRKRNISTHTLLGSSVKDGAKKNPWQGPDGTGPDKRNEAEWHRGPGKGARMLHACWNKYRVEGNELESLSLGNLERKRESIRLQKQTKKRYR